MPRGENLHLVATPETRAKGGRARAAKLRAERKEARKLAAELADRRLTERGIGLVMTFDPNISARTCRHVTPLGQFHD